MQQKINYIALLMLIILGVAIGNLTSSWLTAKYNNTGTENIANKAKNVISESTSDFEETPNNLDISNDAALTHSKQIELTGESVGNSTGSQTRETVKLSPNNQIQTNETTPATSSEELIEQRRLDENGLRLSKRCNEWTTVHKDMNTPSSDRGMKKHCAEFYDYLSFGTLPSSN